MITLSQCGQCTCFASWIVHNIKSCWTYICVITVPKWTRCQLLPMGCQEFNKIDDYTFLSGQCTCFASWIANNIKNVVGLISVLLQFLSGQGVSFGPWVVNNSVKNG